MTKTIELKPSRKIAKKVHDLVKLGLVIGLGVPVPGKMCVEAAVNFAFGRPHGDNPPCVGAAVRKFKIRLNDAPWSSAAARGQGMLKLSIAQLGSNQLDQAAFKELIAFKGLTKVLPFYMRKFAETFKKKLSFC